MSQFYASIQGHRGTATRLGTKKSGIHGHIRGWNIGIEVDCLYDADKEKDVVRVYKTKGSNGGGSTFLGEFSEGEETEGIELLLWLFSRDENLPKFMGLSKDLDKVIEERLAAG